MTVEPRSRTVDVELVVAAEVGGQASPCAHAVPALGPSTSTYGTALCGFPADQLTVVPGLRWEQIEVESRCRYCQQDWTGDQG